MPRPTNTSDRRAQIIDALIAVMATQGYDGASIGDIARHAGLAPGLVHYHFDSKLEILVEAVRTIAARHEAALDARTAGTPVRQRAGESVRERLDDAPVRERDPVRERHDAPVRERDPVRERLDAPVREREAVRELVAFIDVHLGLGAHAAPDLLACWVLVVAEALREKRVRTEVERVLASLRARVVDILERGNAAKVFACADVPAAAAALIAIIQGYFAVAATARDVIPSGSAARSTIRMMEALVGARLIPGLARRPTSRKRRAR